MDRTKLTPFGRSLILVLILMIGAIAGAAGATATRPHAQAWRCISVRPGETLWSLASRVGGADHRETVARIVEENGLEGRPLEAGSSIWLPSEADLDGLMRANAATCPTHS